jgi:hypothetical protein
MNSALRSPLCFLLSASLAFRPNASAATSPLSPADALASFELADPTLTIELVAAEPDVSSPVSLTWDADGRLFVAEMQDYPIGPGPGRIPPAARQGTAMADMKPHRCSPNLFLIPMEFSLGTTEFWVTAAPELLFLKDNDQDGRADERRVVLTGFAGGQSTTARERTHLGRRWLGLWCQWT